MKTEATIMKIAGVREIREKTAAYLGGSEPFLVTKHGKISGVYVPLETPDRLPDDWRREIGRILGLYFARLLDQKGVSEREILEDFRAFRRGRRGR
jgi:hypothetical protein